MINQNYWFHLTNGFAPPYLVLDASPAAVMTFLLDRGQRSSQLWRFEYIYTQTEIGAHVYRLHNRATGYDQSLAFTSVNPVKIEMKPTMGAVANQDWRVTSHENGMPGHYRLFNLGVNQALDSTLDAPTLGGSDPKSPVRGQIWRFNPMATLEDLPTPPGEMHKAPFDKYIQAQGVHILGSKFVSTWAMLQVEEVINNIVLSIKDESRQQAFKDKMTMVMNYCDTPNGSETCYGEKLGTYPFVGDLGLNATRGGCNNSYLWVTEEMMCTAGVRSRDKGIAIKARDRTYRQFDQIVHEWGHFVDRVLNLASPFAFEKAQFRNPREQYAWCTEAWFKNRFDCEPGDRDFECDPDKSGSDKSQDRETLKRGKKLADGRTLYQYLAETFDEKRDFYPTTLYHKLFV